MKHVLISCLLLLSGFTQFAVCQGKKNNDIIGIWKGTSICQVKNSPCHDEIVVYHLSQDKTDSTYIIQANKIVNGIEEDMGTLNCIYNKTKKQLTCIYKNKKGQESLWEFNISGTQMKGRLILLEDKTLYRLIELKKEL